MCFFWALVNVSIFETNTFHLISVNCWLLGFITRRLSDGRRFEDFISVKIEFDLKSAIILLAL